MAVSSTTGVGQGSVTKIINQQPQQLYKFMQKSSCLFISKLGNDGNDGSIIFPLLTFSKATEISQLNFNNCIVCLDIGIYEEGIIVIPENTTIFAPNAKIKGAIIIKKGCKITLKELENTGLELLADYGGIDQVAIQKNDTGASYIDIETIHSNGLIGVTNSNLGVLFLTCGQLFVNAIVPVPGIPAGIGIITPGSAVGHIHLSVRDLYLNRDLCIGIGTVGTNANIVGRIDHILIINNHKDTVGIYATEGIIKMDINEIKATWCLFSGGGSNPSINLTTNFLNAVNHDTFFADDEAYHIDAGELNLVCTKLSGLQVVSGSGIARTLIPS